MFRIATHAILSIVLISFVAACNSDGPNRYSSSEKTMKVSIKASSNELVQNETVTVQSRTQNTLGHDAQLKWESTGGNINRMNSGRDVQVTFDKPGTYTINCILTSDGREVSRDSVDVRVKPLQ